MLEPLDFDSIYDDCEQKSKKYSDPNAAMHGALMEHLRLSIRKHNDVLTLYKQQLEQNK